MKTKPIYNKNRDLKSLPLSEPTQVTVQPTTSAFNNKALFMVIGIAACMLLLRRDSKQRRG